MTEPTWDNAKQVHIKDESRSDFFQVPMIVYMLSPTPFELTFWEVVRQVAWKEDSECWIATPELASLSMMSLGRAAQCRDFLIKVGLLNGRLEKVKGSNVRSIWHLSIPSNIWSLNEQFMKPYRSWRNRLEYKLKQAEQLKSDRLETKNNKAQELSSGETFQEDLSPTETSKNGQEVSWSETGAKELSLGETYPLSGETYPSPNVCNNILSLNIKEEDRDIHLNPEEVWVSIQEQLRQTFNKKDFDTYISSTIIPRWDKHTLVIGTINPYILEWLNQKVKPYAVRLIRPIIGNELGDIRFELMFVNNK